MRKKNVDKNEIIGNSALKLIDQHDPMLHSPAEEFNISEALELDENACKHIIEAIAEFMIEKKGIGLAAPQVGIPYRILTFGNPADRDSIVGMFNPKIVDYSEESSIITEGCLSYPEIFAKIRRPDKIRVRFADMHGETGTHIYEGITAHCIQHEIDHLDGIVFKERTTKYHWEQAQRRAKKVKRLKRKNG